MTREDFNELKEHLINNSESLEISSSQFDVLLDLIEEKVEE